MNESELENQLRTLRPALPSREMETRIGRELGDLRRTEARTPKIAAASQAPGLITRWLDRLLWSGFGAAAAVLVMISLTSHESHVMSRDVVPLDVSSLQPVLASEEDLGWRDEGVQFDTHGQPVLKLRRVAVERQAWADLKNAGVIQVETPRQEVMWMPVTLH